MLVPGLKGGNYEGLRRHNEVVNWGSLELGEESQSLGLKSGVHGNLKEIKYNNCHSNR